MSKVKFPSWFDVRNEEPANKRVYGLAPLSKFLTDNDIKGIRNSDAYGDTNLDALKSSINADGKLKIQNPPHVYLAKEQEEDCLRVVGGNRRISAAHLLAAQKIIPAETPVECYLYLTDDRKEINRLAAVDNVLRVNYDEMEEFRQIMSLDRAGHSVVEIAAIMGKNDRKVERYLAIGRHKLFETMLEGGMPYSKLAALSEKIEGKKDAAVRKAAFSFFEQWCKEVAPQRKEQKKNEAARRNKNIDEKNLVLGKLLEPGEYEGWIRDIELGEAPTGKAKYKAVDVAVENGRLKIGGITVNLADATYSELAKILARYQAKAIPMIREEMERKKLLRKTENLDDAEAELLSKLGVGDEEDDTASEPVEPDTADEDESFDEDPD